MALALAVMASVGDGFKPWARLESRVIERPPLNMMGFEKQVGYPFDSLNPLDFLG
jgi:hypothetical protein